MKSVLAVTVLIDSYLSTYDFMSPTVPDLDDIVPLPPAPLPEMGRQNRLSTLGGGRRTPKALGRTDEKASR